MRPCQPKTDFPSKRAASFSNALATGVPLVLALMAAQVDSEALGKQIAEQPASANQPGASLETADKAPAIRSAQWFNWANACLNGQWRNC